MDKDDGGEGQGVVRFRKYHRLYYFYISPTFDIIAQRRKKLSADPLPFALL